VTSDRYPEEKPRRVTPGGESPPRSFRWLLQQRPPNGAADRCFRFGGVPASCSASSQQTSSRQRRGRAGSPSNRDPVQSGCRHHGCDVARVESRQMGTADAPRLVAPRSRGARWTLLLAVGGGGPRRDASTQAPRRDSATRPPSPPLSGMSSRAGARPPSPLGRLRSCCQARHLCPCIRVGLDGAPSATAARVASRGTDGSVPRFTSKQRSLRERRPTLRQAVLHGAGDRSPCAGVSPRQHELSFPRWATWTRRRMTTARAPWTSFDTSNLPTNREIRSLTVGPRAQDGWTR